MTDQIEAMQVELNEITSRINALHALIYKNDEFKTLDTLELVRMIKQSAFMQAYADVLMRRIWAVDNPNGG